MRGTVGRAVKFSIRSEAEGSGFPRRARAGSVRAMSDSFISAFLLLLLVLDPLGNVLSFRSLTRNLTPARRRFVIVRECLIGSGVLLAFAFGGSWFLRYTGVHPGTLGITGGVLLFIIGLQMLFKGDVTMHDDPESGPQSEPFIVPMALPLFAGPSSIALTVIHASPEADHRWPWIAGMLCAAAVATLVLATSDSLLRRIGPVAVSALARLMGLALTAIAIQMILDGFARYWAALPKA